MSYASSGTLKSIRCKVALASTAFLAVCALLTATPFTDNLTNTTYVHDDSGSCIFDVSGGLLAVTCTGGYSGQAIFGWSLSGTSAYSGGFSTDPANGQNVFQMDGISFITPASSIQATIGIALFSGTSAGSLSHVGWIGQDGLFAGGPSAITGTSLMSNITDLVGSGKFWAVQIVVDTHGQSNVGASFDTLSAVSAIPEPTAFATVCGIMVLGLALRRRTIATRV